MNPLKGTAGVRPVRTGDRAAIRALLEATAEFDAGDVAIALELVDHAIAGTDDYQVLVASNETDAVVGYVCFGPTPMTKGTYDLYWIASASSARRTGVGRTLIAAVERALELVRARLVRVETSSRDDYAATRAFYDRVGYQVLARIADFYSDGDDLVIYGRYLTNHR